MFVYFVSFSWSSMGMWATIVFLNKISPYQLNSFSVCYLINMAHHIKNYHTAYNLCVSRISFSNYKHNLIMTHLYFSHLKHIQHAQGGTKQLWTHLRNFSHTQEQYPYYMIYFLIQCYHYTLNTLLSCFNTCKCFFYVPVQTGNSFTFHQICIYHGQTCLSFRDNRLCNDLVQIPFTYLLHKHNNCGNIMV